MGKAFCDLTKPIPQQGTMRLVPGREGRNPPSHILNFHDAHLIETFNVLYSDVCTHLCCTNQKSRRFLKKTKKKNTTVLSLECIKARVLSLCNLILG